MGYSTIFIVVRKREIFSRPPIQAWEGENGGNLEISEFESNGGKKDLVSKEESSKDTRKEGERLQRDAKISR